MRAGSGTELETMMDKRDKLMKAFNDRLSSDIKIFMMKADDDQCDAIQAFCFQLSLKTSKVEIVFEEDEKVTRSCILVTNNIRYHAEPNGTELEPFLEALAILDGQKPKLDPKIKKRLDALQIPVSFKLYVTPGCPHCPQAARDLIALCAAHPNVYVDVIDAELFQGMAQTDKVQSAPTIILNNEFRWSGATYLNEIVEVMTCADLTTLSAKAMESLVNEGGADQVTALLLRSKKAIPGFNELLVHESWSVRLAAMVVMEELIAKDMALATACIAPFQERLADLDDQVKGDIVDLAGKTCGKDWLPTLESLSKAGGDEELMDIVQEAIESIKARG